MSAAEAWLMSGHELANLESHAERLIEYLRANHASYLSLDEEAVGLAQECVGPERPAACDTIMAIVRERMGYCYDDITLMHRGIISDVIPLSLRD